MDKFVNTNEMKRTQQNQVGTYLKVLEEGRAACEEYPEVVVQK